MQTTVFTLRRKLFVFFLFSSQISNSNQDTWRKVMISKRKYPVCSNVFLFPRHIIDIRKEICFWRRSVEKSMLLTRFSGLCFLIAKPENRVKYWIRKINGDRYRSIWRGWDRCAWLLVKINLGFIFVSWGENCCCLYPIKQRFHLEAGKIFLIKLMIWKYLYDCFRLFYVNDNCLLYGRCSVR